MTKGEVAGRIWRLPPLILHPFAKQEDTERVVEGSQLDLSLAKAQRSEDEATLRKLLACRYHEIRMLYFIGKDVFRWMEQCLDFAAREPEIEEADLRQQSFADFLTSGAPDSVDAKLKGWGVADYQVLFSRALGLHAVFSQPPLFDHLSVEFLRNYYRYADALYTAYLQSVTYRTVGSPAFEFDVYASGEYSKMLSDQWTAP